MLALAQGRPLRKALDPVMPNLELESCANTETGSLLIAGLDFTKRLDPLTLHL